MISTGEDREDANLPDLDLPDGWSASVPDEADAPELTKLLRRHDELVRDTVAIHGGEVVAQGDMPLVLKQTQSLTIQYLAPLLPAQPQTVTPGTESGGRIFQHRIDATLHARQFSLAIQQLDKITQRGCGHCR